MKVKLLGRPTQAQLEAYQLAMSAYNSPEFKEWWDKTEFTEIPKGRTKAGILLELEKVQAQVMWVLVNRPWYKRWSSVIGWAEGEYIYTYTQQFNRMSPIERSSHFAHELLHCFPYLITHSFNPSKERDNSVPYQVGAFVEKFLRG